MKHVPFSAVDSRYDVTRLWLRVVFFVLKWSVRPPVMAF